MKPNIKSINYSLDEVLPLLQDQRANLILNGRDYNKTKLLRLIGRNGVTCAICGISGTHFVHSNKLNTILLMFKNEHGKFIRMNKDHIIPKVKGGSNGYDNLQLTCTVCNTQKRHFIEYNEEDINWLSKLTYMAIIRMWIRLTPDNYNFYLWLGSELVIWEYVKSFKLGFEFDAYACQAAYDTVNFEMHEAYYKVKNQEEHNTTLKNIFDYFHKTH